MSSASGTGSSPSRGELNVRWGFRKGIPLRAYETISFVRVTKATLVRPPGLGRQVCLVPPGRQARR